MRNLVAGNRCMAIDACVATGLPVRGAWQLCRLAGFPRQGLVRPGCIMAAGTEALTWGYCEVVDV